MNITTLPKLNITPLGKDTLDLTAEFLFLNWHQTYDSHLPDQITNERSQDYFKHELEMNIGTAWIAKLGRRINGLISVSSNCIDHIWVEKKYQRRRLGSTLLDTALNHFRLKDFENAQVGLESFNHNAQLFFTAMDWEKIGSEYVNITQDEMVCALVFSKRLNL